MRLALAFRLSSYLTLGLACLALVQAEQEFLPGIYWFGAAVLGLLGAAFFLEGRWELPNWAANVLGLFIAAGVVVWVWMDFRGADDSWVQTLPLPLALLPYVGP